MSKCQIILVLLQNGGDTPVGTRIRISVSGVVLKCASFELGRVSEGASCIRCHRPFIAALKGGWMEGQMGSNVGR